MTAFAYLSESLLKLFLRAYVQRTYTISTELKCKYHVLRMTAVLMYDIIYDFKF